LVRNVLEEAAPRLFAPAEEPRLPEILVADPETELPPGATGNQSTSDPLAGIEESAAQEEGASFSEVEYSYPEILFREEAEEVIASFYPTALQRAGVGGSVKLQLWVDASGRVDHIQMREGSGYQSLDLAAMRAATQLRYRPATRDGIPVGTWVEFTVNFVPGSQQGGGHPDPSPREGPGA
jgi:protein TonB